MEVGELPGRVMIKPWSREEEGEKRGGGGEGRGEEVENRREEGEEEEEGGVKVRSKLTRTHGLTIRFEWLLNVLLIGPLFLSQFIPL